MKYGASIDLYDKLSLFSLMIFNWSENLPNFFGSNIVLQFAILIKKRGLWKFLVLKLNKSNGLDHKYFIALFNLNWKLVKFNKQIGIT